MIGDPTNCRVCLFKFDSNVHKKIHITTMTPELREYLKGCLKVCKALLKDL